MNRKVHREYYELQIERDRDGDRQRKREHRNRQARRQHARYRDHEQHDEQHERAAVLFATERLNQEERPGHAEEQVEQNEAQPPRAQIDGGGLLVEKAPAGANDDEMDDERADRPYAGGQRSRPQRREQPDGDDQEQNY